MLKVRSEISAILNGIDDIKAVTATWSDNYETVPLAYYEISNNTASITTEAGEDVSRVQATIHIFADTLKKAEEIAVQVDEAITSNYWSRTNYFTRSEKFEHITLTYLVDIDKISGEHYIAI